MQSALDFAMQLHFAPSCTKFRNRWRTTCKLKAVELQQRSASPNRGALTFLHGLERVVGLDELDGVRDLLALQDVVTQAEVGHGELEHLIVPHGILFEDGA